MEEACYSGLCLGLAVGGCEKCNNNTDNEPKSDDIRNGSELRERSISLSLGPSSAMSTEEDDREGEEEEEEKEEDPMPVDQVTAPGGPNNPRSTDGNSLDGSRKKLMLSKDQLALLEEAFRHHRNLTAVLSFPLCDAHNLPFSHVFHQNSFACSRSFSSVTHYYHQNFRFDDDDVITIVRTLLMLLRDRFIFVGVAFSKLDQISRTNQSMGRVDFLHYNNCRIRKGN